MSIGIIRNLGVNKTSKGLVLYDNGKWKVPYDNTGYKLNNNYTGDGGFTLRADSMTTPTVGYTHNRCISASNPIDLTPFTMAKMIVDGVEYVVDITNVNQNAYIILNSYGGANADMKLRMYICTINIANFGPNAITSLSDAQAPVVTTSTKITRVELA